jgi:hypothetical protein
MISRNIQKPERKYQHLFKLDGKVYDVCVKCGDLNLNRGKRKILYHYMKCRISNDVWRKNHNHNMKDGFCIKCGESSIDILHKVFDRRRKVSFKMSCQMSDKEYIVRKVI